MSSNKGTQPAAGLMILCNVMGSDIDSDGEIPINPSQREDAESDSVVEGVTQAGLSARRRRQCDDNDPSASSSDEDVASESPPHCFVYESEHDKDSFEEFTKNEVAYGKTVSNMRRSCAAFFIDNNKDPSLFFAMCVGVKPEMVDALEQSPFKEAKAAEGKVKIGNKQMHAEVLRRGHYLFHELDKDDENHPLKDMRQKNSTL